MGWLGCDGLESAINSFGGMKEVYKGGGPKGFIGRKEDAHGTATVGTTQKCIRSSSRPLYSFRTSISDIKRIVLLFVSPWRSLHFESSNGFGRLEFRLILSTTNQDKPASRKGATGVNSIVR